MYTTISVWPLMVVGQVAAEPGGGAEAASNVTVQSVWDFVVKGGPMMIPIGLCSLVALAVVIERMVSLRRRNIIPPKFLPGLKKALGTDGNNRGEALEFCRNNGSPIADVLATGIKRLGEPVELLEKHIQEAGQREVLKLRKYLRLLSVVASIAPLMGLLGTIFGMIIAFQTVATSGEALGKAELLAKGIYQAMITTAAGLMLAIPVLIAYHWISAKIDGLVSEIDRLTVEFVEDYAQPRLIDEKQPPRLQPVEEPEEDAGTADGSEEPAAATA